MQFRMHFKLEIDPFSDQQDLSNRQDDRFREIWRCFPKHLYNHPGN